MYYLVMEFGERICSAWGFDYLGVFRCLDGWMDGCFKRKKIGMHASQQIKDESQVKCRNIKK